MPALCRQRYTTLYFIRLPKKEKQTRKLPGLLTTCCLQRYRNDLVPHTHLIVAGTAIDRAIIFGQERHLGLYTTFGAGDRVHLARWTLTARRADAAALRAARGATVGAAGWLVHQPFLLVKLLLTSGEHEILTALTTLESFVREAQLGASFESIGYPVRWSLVAWLTRVSPSSVGRPCAMPERDRVGYRTKHTLF